MRTRLVLATALVGAMAAIAAAPLAPAGAAPLPWLGDSPLATLVYAQSGQGQEPVTPPSDPEPEPRQESVEESQPEPEQAEPAEPAEEAEPVEEEPEPPVEQAEPEQAVEPEPVTLGDVSAMLQSAITAKAANQVTVGAASDALEGARQALADAEESYAGAMEGQGEHNAAIRAAAQRLVDYVTATHLQ